MDGAVLRRKFLIGLLDRKEELFIRFERYFGWKQVDAGEDNSGGRVSGTGGSPGGCLEQLLLWEWPMWHGHKEVEKGTMLWDLIAAHNVFDIQLYEYAEAIFRDQWILLS